MRAFSTFRNAAALAVALTMASAGFVAAQASPLDSETTLKSGRYRKQALPPDPCKGKMNCRVSAKNIKQLPPDPCKGPACKKW
jgi:hypothetical protein